MRPLGTRVPHPSTLGKITTRCGPETIAKLNQALLAKAGAEKVVRLDKVRADTTVVAASTENRDQDSESATSRHRVS